jgi:hypothetical protein
MTLCRAVVLSSMIGFCFGSDAAAQALGTFQWQLQPFCNNLTVNVTQQGGVFTVDGSDDQCGAPQRAPLVGVATPNPDGTIGFGLHLVTVPGGRAVSVDARISLSTLSGTWSDSAGNSGTFAFNARTGGAPRPLPTLPAGSVTAAQLAPGAVTSASLANGSVTAQKLAVALPKLVWSGLTTVPIVLGEVENTIVRSVTIAVPAAGQVKLDASGLFGFVLNGVNQLAWCSITTGTEVETAHYLYAQVLPASVGTINTLANVPFAGGRVYSVGPGTFTANLVCTATYLGPSFTVSIQTAQLTALFVPD